MRAELVDYGFEQLQKSVWVTPYRAAEQLKTTLEDMGIDRWVKLMVAEALFEDEGLRRKFGMGT